MINSVSTENNTTSQDPSCCPEVTSAKVRGSSGVIRPSGVWKTWISPVCNPTSTFNHLYLDIRGKFRKTLHSYSLEIVICFAS